VRAHSRARAGRLPACLDARRRPTGCRLDGVKPDIQCVRTHWIRGFMAFRLTRRTRIVMLVVPV